MTSDLVSIFAKIVLLAACIYGIKTKYRILATTILVVLIPLTFFSMVINIPILFSPLTPEFHGKVVDAETKKTLAGINIKAGWMASSASVGGSSGEYYKLYKTVTDNNGEFVLPKGLKALSKWDLLGTRNFDRVIITAYPSGYDYKVKRAHYTSETGFTLSLDKVKSDKEFLDNILDYYHGLFLMHKGSGDEISDPEEKEWLKNAYYQFERIYPYSNEDKKYLESIATILISIKVHDCVYIFQKILAKYPDDATLAWFAKNNINAYKKIYNIK